MALVVRNGHVVRYRSWKEDLIEEGKEEREQERAQMKSCVRKIGAKLASSYIGCVLMLSDTTSLIGREMYIKGRR